MSDSVMGGTKPWGTVVVNMANDIDKMEADRFGRAGEALRNLAGWGLVGALMWAPWAMGSIPGWAAHTLQAILAAVGGVWLVSVALRRRVGASRGGWICGGLCSLLIVQGAWMSLNAQRRYVFEGDPRFVSIGSPWETLPGSWDASLSWEATGVAAGVLLALLVARDLSRSAHWRYRLWWVMSVNLAVIGGLGALMAAELAPTPAMYELGTAGDPFGPYDYHGDAGAILCLGLALSLGLLRSIYGRWLTLATLVILGSLLFGLFINVARAGMLVATGLLTLNALDWCLRRPWSAVKARKGAVAGGGWPRVAGVGAILLMVGSSVAVLAGPRLVERWSRFSETFWPRLLRDKIGLGMATEAPLFGIGPGVFKAACPISPHFDPRLYSLWRSTPYEPGTRPTTWDYLLMDYLQTQIEWGAVGSVLWGVLVSGGVWLVVRAGRRFGRESEKTSEPQRMLAFALATALLAVGLYALIDAPMQIPSIQLYVGVVLGMCWGSSQWGRA